MSDELDTIRTRLLDFELYGITEQQKAVLGDALEQLRKDAARKRDAIAMLQVQNVQAHLNALIPREPEGKSMIENFSVRLRREETFRHLKALCNNDTLYAISDYGEKWEEEDFERIVISDQQALTGGSARGAVIGTVRLLPQDNGTTLMFVNKDALFHLEISDAGEKLFLGFIERAKVHFGELGLLVQGTLEAQENAQNKYKNIQNAREKRSQFLEHLYDEAGANSNAMINMYELGSELGFQKGETGQVVDYLVGEGFVRHMALGGGIIITHRGIVEIEEAIAHHIQKATFYPSINIINVGTMIGSQIQQSTTQSDQKVTISIDDIKSIETRENAQKLKSSSSAQEPSPIWKIVISIILLGFALAGFVWLPWYSSILWLIFLVVAYPVCLAFTAARQSMSNRNLAEIYKAGLAQVPVIGKLFYHRP